eukprot:Gb_34928 [translate_table: standard]
MDAFFTLQELRSELSALGHDDVPDDVIMAFLAQLQITVPDCLPGNNSRQHAQICLQTSESNSSSLTQRSKVAHVDQHDDTQEGNLGRQSASFQLENGGEPFPTYLPQKGNKNLRTEKSSNVEVSWDISIGAKPLHRSSVGRVEESVVDQNVRLKSASPNKHSEKNKDQSKPKCANGGNNNKNQEHYWISVENKALINKSPGYNYQVSTEEFLRDCSKPICMLGESNTVQSDHQSEKGEYSSEENPFIDHGSANKSDNSDYSAKLHDKERASNDMHGHETTNTNKIRGRQPAILKHLSTKVSHGHLDKTRSKIPQIVLNQNNNSTSHATAPSRSQKIDRASNGYKEDVNGLRPAWNLSNTESTKSIPPQQPKANSKQGPYLHTVNDEKMLRSRERSRSKDRITTPRRRGKIDRVARYAEMQKIWKKDSFLSAADGRRKKQSFHKMFSNMHITHEQPREYPNVVHGRSEAASGRKQQNFPTIQVFAPN